MCVYIPYKIKATCKGYTGMAGGAGKVKSPNLANVGFAGPA